MSEKKISIIIPAFNEEKNLEMVIKKLKKNNYISKIIIVNDGSSDHTEDIAKKNKCAVLSHIINLGQWAALSTGFYIALKSNPDIIVTLDADGQHDPEDLTLIIKPIIDENADFVIGSRFLKGQPNMAIYRYVGIKIFNLLIKKITGFPYTDCTSGYKAYTNSLLRKILPYLQEPQYGALESLIVISRYKPNIKEVAIQPISNRKSNKGNIKFGLNLLRTIYKTNGY